MPILCLLLGSLVWGAEVSAWDLYERGRDEEKAGHMAKAYVLYSEAAAMEPKNTMYWLRSQAVKSRAALEAKVAPQIDADEVEALTRGEVPPVPLPEATAKDRQDAAKIQPPAELNGKDGLQDFDFREDSQKLYQDVAKAYGLGCVFDADYLPMPAFHFHLNGVNFRDALHGLELATGTFIVPLSSKLFLVAKDTPQKRSEQEPMAVVSVPVPPSTNVQEFNALVTAVQQTMSIQKVAFDTQNSTVIFRDHLSKLLPALALMDDLSAPHAQVMLELRFVEVSRNDMLTYGVNFPTLFSLQPLTTWLNNQVSLPSGGISGLLSFGGGKTLIGIGVMSASAVAQMSAATGKVLLSAQLRSLDNQPATMHIGDRYPVLTSGYFGAGGSPGTTTNTGTGTTNTGTNTGTPGAGAGTLQLTQSSFTWSYTSGGDQPAAATVTVTSTAGSIDYTATVESSSPWLTVNNQNTAFGTLPATLTIAPGIALASLGVGSYQGLVQVSGSDGSIAYVTVNLTVNGNPQTLTLTPSSISLLSQAGGLVVQQAVSVVSTVGGDVTATVSGAGLSIQINNSSVTAGTAGYVTVVGNPAGLAAQTYLGVLSVTVGGFTQEEQVNFQVTGSGSLELSQTSIPWTYSSGGTFPAETTVTLTSLGGAGSYTATVTSTGNWLLVNGATQTTGVLPGTLVVAPASNLSQLSTGTYTGTVQITGSDGSLAYLNVNLTVNGGTASGLTVSPNPISLSAPLGGSAVQQTITVTSINSGTLSATVAGSGLSLTLPTDTTVTANQAFTFTLTADPTGLTSQTYTGSLSVTVADTTQSVQVSFAVGTINSGTNGTSVYTPIPSFNFEDLGLSLKVTPTVHSMEETSLDIDAEFKVLTGQSIDGVPIISNRVMKSKARVLNGEWAVVGGLLNTQEARNIAGLAGLGRVRGLGALFSTREHDFSKNEVIILMRPVVLTPPNQAVPRTYATGTDAKPVTPF